MRIIFVRLKTTIEVDRRPTTDLRMNTTRVEPGNCKELTLSRDELGLGVAFVDSEGKKFVPMTNVALIHYAEDKPAAKK